MTNYLSTAMLSAGASCFGGIIAMEGEMSEAEINTLLASKTMMDVQPLMLEGMLDAYAEQADNQQAAGVITGVGSIVAGGVQLGITGMGEKAGKAAYEEELGTPAIKATVAPVESELPQAKSTVVGQNSKDIEMDDYSNLPADSNSPNAPKTVQKEADVVTGKQKTAEEIKEENKLRDQKKLSKIQTYQNIAQLAGTSLNGIATVAKSPFDASATKNAGTAQAMGTVISGNQTAQASNAALAKTYEDAFATANQILAGIVSSGKN